MVVGEYKPAMGNVPEVIKKSFYGQGVIYKNTEAFESDLDTVCYIPELFEDKYTRRDFLRICNQQEEIARVVFEAVDWQSPETYVDELFRDQELSVCEQCEKWYWSYDGQKCPSCV